MRALVPLLIWLAMGIALFLCVWLAHAQSREALIFRLMLGDAAFVLYVAIIYLIAAP